jgi:hypothetical protein
VAKSVDWGRPEVTVALDPRPPPTRQIRKGAAGEGTLQSPDGTRHATGPMSVNGTFRTSTASRSASAFGRIADVRRVRCSITMDRRIFGVCNAPSLQSPISEWPLLVRSGHSPKPQGPLCAIRDPPQQISGYSMTSSALTNNVGGIVRPSIFAVRWLITISNFVGCSIGRSAGLAPLRIRST